MSWSPEKSDVILDHFAERPGTASTIGSSTLDDNPLTRLEAEAIATAIRERAAERQIHVEVAVRPINGDSGYADLEVTHLVDQ